MIGRVGEIFLQIRKTVKFYRTSHGGPLIVRLEEIFLRIRKTVHGGPLIVRLEEIFLQIRKTVHGRPYRIENTSDCNESVLNQTLRDYFVRDYSVSTSD